MFPRILMGALCGVIFKGLVRVDKTRHKVIAYPVTGLCGALQTLDIGLNYTETVDTGTKYIVGVVNSCLYFFAQYFLNFRVGRFLSYLVF